MRATLAACALLAACARPRVHAPSPPRALPAVDDERWESTLLLIGDAGAPGRRVDGRPDPVLRAAARVLRGATGARAVVFLGDNVYHDGYPPVSVRGEPASGEERRARTILERQARLDTPPGDADALDPTIPRWFVPGNHDWNDASVWNALVGAPRDGARRAVAQDAYLRTLGAEVRALPAGGCPGPAVRDVGRRLRVIAIDTQWWLQDRRASDAGACDGVADRAASVRALRAAIAGAGDRRVIVVGHHPLATAGPHGAHCGGEIVCALSRPFRMAVPYFTGRQDLTNRRNVAMRRAVESALRDRPPLVYAAGHEHALQVFRGGVADWYLVSGSGNYGHTERVGCRRASTLALDAGGFMRVDATHDGRVRLTVLTAGPDGVPVVRYRRWLTEPEGVRSADDGANC
ncbi:MAG: hypothetical protein ACXW61_03455 [Gemmatirosa sp.]